MKGLNTPGLQEALHILQDLLPDRLTYANKGLACQGAAFRVRQMPASISEAISPFCSRIWLTILIEDTTPIQKNQVLLCL